ncbi:DUF4400 domain-containing protein [Pseudomonas guariconensis]|uniref:DUF4400 domain-containing protein n=1 Tax=Pseudomonas guariconensis TaxID=1288410 RepID=UPI003B66F3CA
MRYLAAQSVTTIQNYALAVLFTVLIFCVRLVVLALTIPLFALAAFTGLVDGLVRRDLRRFGSGRESSYLYTRHAGPSYRWPSSPGRSTWPSRSASARCWTSAAATKLFRLEFLR